MDRLCDWYAVHGFRQIDLKDILFAIRRGAARAPHCWLHAVGEPGMMPPPIPPVGKAFSDMVQPALNHSLGLHINLSGITLQVVADEPGFLPYTLDRGADAPPKVVIRDMASVHDLLCLAHEIAHAAQLLLSRGSFMPPVAREVCAFLGEMALVEWARMREPDLFPGLLAAWLQDDAAYCAADLDPLSEALGDPQTPYEYRMNYPIARAAAVLLFENATPAALGELFAAGDAAMALLPLELITRASALPPIPVRVPNAPATDAYRCLGVVSLLDLASENAHAQVPIGEAYQWILPHLRTGTLHVGIDDARRPVGYACWNEAPAAGLEITRRVAPFDPERLERSLEARLALRGAPASSADAA